MNAAESRAYDAKAAEWWENPGTYEQWKSEYGGGDEARNRSNFDCMG